MKKKKVKGFTLVELIAVMAIMAIVGALVLTLFNYQSKWFGKVNKETRIQDEARITIMALENDIRTGRNKSYATDINKDSNDPSISEVTQINGSNIPGGSSKVIMQFKRRYSKEDSEEEVLVNYFYVLKGNELILLKEDTTISKPNSLVIQTRLSRNVKSIQIISGAKSTEVKLKLDNGEGTKEFNTVVSPRNS